MKNLKLSFALIIAILAVGTTIATKANFGKRVVTRCFYDINLISEDGSATFFLDADKTPTAIPCATAKSQVANTPYITGATLTNSFLNESSCPSDVEFCCALVTEITSSDPGYTEAQFVNLGEGLRKYKIASADDVRCKE